MAKYFFLIFLYLCQSSFAQPDFQKTLQTKLILANNGSNITIEAGQFQLKYSLSLEGKADIVISGAGLDKTILSFKNQTDGAEGFRISNGKNITLQNLTLQDSRGDLVKAMNVQNITFKNVKVEWTGPPAASNGAYGLYPVQCTGVVIDSCVAIGASDAGIYVGQSTDIEVKNSVAYHNVAGIEIENSLNATVHHCESYENTGGVLVFDLPDLILKKGGNCKIFENYIHDNNLPNFAPKGNIVAGVPDGTGIMLLACNNVEIFKNKIINNQSLSTSIISYYMSGKKLTDQAYYPYPTAISIHHNNYQRLPTKPTKKGTMGKIFRFKLHFGKNVPHIIYDGIIDTANLDANGKMLANKRFCIDNNSNQSIASIDAANDFKSINNDPNQFTCK